MPPRRLALAATLCLAASAAAAHDGVHLKAEIPVPSEGSAFDYVTVGAGRLFIGHRAEGLQAMDLADPSKIVTIAQTKGSNGATIAADLGLGFSENGDGTLTVFKLSDLSVVEQIRVGEELDSTRYDPVTQRLAVFGLPGSDKKGSTVAVFQMPQRTRLPDIANDSAKLENSVADGAGGVFVAAQDLGAIVRLDMKELKQTASWPVPCKQPTGLDYDAKNARLMVGCRGGFSEPMFLVVNAQTGETVFKAPTSPGNDGVAYDAARGRVYVTNGIGAHLMVFEQTGPDGYRLNEVVGTRPMAKTLALDPASGDVFTIAAEPVYDAAKKNLAAIAPFYPNGYTPGTFRVLRYGR
jgi:DNA-binding beta-propeller fold protein YncE